MNKEEFLSLLAMRLNGLPQYDIDRSVDYYREMIDDRIEDGMSEYEAVAAVGSVDEAVRQILNDIPLAKIAAQRVRPKEGFQWWWIALLVVGAPLWIGLAIGAIAVIICVYVLVWSVVIAMFCGVMALGAGAIFGVLYGLMTLLSGGLAKGIFYIGAGIACVGLTVLAVFVSIKAAKWVIRFSKRFILWIKSLFMGRE